MTPYQAKFAREAKPNPRDWLIVLISKGSSLFKLVYIGGLRC